MPAHVRSLILSVITLALVVASGLVSGAEFYIDPIAGDPTGDGSQENPWRSLQEVIESDLIETRVWESLPYAPGAALVAVNIGAPVQAGDTLWLLSGFHGEVDLRGAYNAAPITVAAAPGHQPKLSRIDLSSAQNWSFRGLSISPSHATPAGSGGTIVQISNHGFWGPTWDVEVADCEIFTVADASSWGAQEWIQTAASGISVGGSRITLQRNHLRNVRFGISVSGDDVVVARNHIEGFSADGLRGLGDRAVFKYNRVENAMVSDGQGDGNHDDGFQSWSVGPGGVGTGEVRDVVLRGNIFINRRDPSDPLLSTMQGIGCFDGLFVNWVVENNVVITDHWHGISFYGMIDSRIVNNTVIDVNETTPGPPWIRVTSSRGTESENVVVRNNLATNYTLGGINVTDDHNIQFNQADAVQHFLAPPYDLHLLPTSSAIDAGSVALAPATDIEGVSRPQGVAPDVGAYEGCPFCIFVDGFESGDVSRWSTVSAD